MSRHLKFWGLGAVLVLLAAPVMADTVGVSPCNREAEGVFRPGLLTVEADGTRVFYPVGENGLTETIVYNRAAALEWIAGQDGFAAGTVFGNYDGFVCGLPCEECGEPSQQTQPQEPDDPDEPDDPEPDDPETEDPETEDPEVEPTE